MFLCVNVWIDTKNVRHLHQICHYQWKIANNNNATKCVIHFILGHVDTCVDFLPNIPCSCWWPIESEWILLIDYFTPASCIVFYLLMCKCVANHLLVFHFVFAHLIIKFIFWFSLFIFLLFEGVYFHCVCCGGSCHFMIGMQEN